MEKTYKRSKPRLVLPSTKYKKSFLRALDSLYLHPYKHFKMSRQEISANFAKFVRRLRALSLNKDLPKGWVPSTTFWLVLGNNYLGGANIRHRLNKNLKKIGGHIGYEIDAQFRQKGYGTLILKLALRKAKKLGIKKVLVTCDQTNLASKKIIEKNGGVLDNKIIVEKGKPDKLRYWIDNR